MPACFSLTGPSPSLAGFPKAILLSSSVIFAVRTPGRSRPGLGSSHFARRYSGNHCCFLFLRLLRCFSSPGSLPWLMDWARDTGGSPSGFPHSDTSGSQGICPSPELFAAYRVFHRLLVPRHPPYALISITNPAVGLPRPLMPSVAWVGIRSIFFTPVFFRTPMPLRAWPRMS